MFWSVLLTTAFVSPPPEEFSRSYGVWVSVDKGQCVYWPTDGGLDGRQLTEALGNGYRTELGLEILTSLDTPNRCVADATAAAGKDGFKVIRARRGTDKDRLHGIP